MIGEIGSRLLRTNKSTRMITSSVVDHIAGSLSLHAGRFISNQSLNVALRIS